MKSTVEQLTPTRVRINVEVPFTELKPDFERTYKQLAQQVRMPGFRPGKAPAKLIEARFGRAAVLEQVVNEALPSRYSEAVSSSDLKPLGQPDIEVTKLEDGEQIEFTAEVDVRPEITLPELDSLKISVDPVAVDDAEVDAELDALRSRFGTLTGVDRPVADGDFVSIDLDASVEGEALEGASTTGLSHQVGSGQLIAGLDDAMVGLSAGESKTFTTTLAGGPQAGKDAEVTVTVQSVKVRELPDADDEFAQLASEFDTIGELRESLTEQVGRTKRMQQAEKIREAALEALLERVEMPLPEAVVQAHVDNAVHNALHAVDHDEDKLAASLAERGSSREQFDDEARSEAEKSVKTQLLLDALADELKIQVEQNDFTSHLLLMSRQYGIAPQQLMQLLQQNNQLPAVLADVRRGKVLAAVVTAAAVSDTDGNAIDTTEFFGAEPSEQAASDGDDEDEGATE